MREECQTAAAATGLEANEAASALQQLVAGRLVSTDGQAETEEQETSDEDSGTTAGSGDEISMSEVEANDSTESCWTVVEGTVYDVTDWIDQHPGGPDRIEGLCGIDGTDMFTDQHSGESEPEGQLTEFEIGELTD